jgi:hypothetical protein
LRLTERATIGSRLVVECIADCMMRSGAIDRGWQGKLHAHAAMSRSNAR